MDAVEGLIDMGIDVLQALQFSAKGMDPCVLKERLGDRLCCTGSDLVVRARLGRPRSNRALLGIAVDPITVHFGSPLCPQQSKYPFDLFC